MTNELILTSVLLTNWVPLTIERPTSTGRLETDQIEIGILVSNRHATVKADDIPNGITILLSSTIHMPPAPLVRRASVPIYVATNVVSPWSLPSYEVPKDFKPMIPGGTIYPSGGYRYQ